MHISNFFKKANLGLLIIRLVLGATYITMGAKKFIAGSPALEYLGSATSAFGINAFPIFWGGLAALCEILGGCLIFLGYKFRFGALVLLLVMITAFYWHFSKGDSFDKYAWALQMLAVFLGLLFTGPGKYSIDKE